MAAELIDRGDEVTFYLTERFAPAVRRVGAGFRPLDPAVDLYDQLNDGTPMSSMTDIGKVVERIGPLVANLFVQGLRTVPAMVDAVRAEEPDCLVYNPMCPWGLALAKMLDVPAITFSATFVMKPGLGFEQLFAPATGSGAMAEILEDVAQTADELHERHGIPRLRLSDMFAPDEDLNIVPLIREFQPDVESLDERYLFFGPSIRSRDDGADFQPPWPATDPTVYVSLGTAVTRGSGEWFARTCFEAFAESPWRVVLAVGTGTDLQELGPPPANFYVREHVPQLEVLDRADVFVTHAGPNSVMEAMWYGVPLVAIPHTMEQLVLSDRAAELGLGVRLDPGEVTAAALRDAVAAVAADPGYRKRAAEISAAARTAGGQRRAADAIQAAVRRAGERHAEETS